MPSSSHLPFSERPAPTPSRPHKSEIQASRFSVSRFLVTALVLPLFALASSTTLPAAEDTAASPTALAFFEKEVRPLLAQHCYECHGERKQKAGLRLDHLDDILKGGEAGPALVRGKPDDSLLIRAIRYKDEDLQMPPDDPLPPAAVGVFEKWIQLGAPWPATDSVARKDKGPRDAHGFTAEDRALWSFQPVSNPTPPALAASDPATAAARTWARTDIDRFIAAKHLEHKLTPAPAASPEELLRRLTFDLHGLPPTPAQLADFTAASLRNPATAVRDLVDQLLASPRYGERWAQHWLDLVRYAESDGYRADAFRPHAWPYRDYVIKSFNTDKPYDQFVREQLAGDELDPDNPDVLVATGYLRNPIYEWNQTDVRGQNEIIMTDLTDNAGEVFLGVSLGCARCHDHKFDPILQKDYYAFRAFFEPVVWPRDRFLATPAQLADHAAKSRAWEEATAELRRERQQLFAAALAKNKKTAYGRFPEEIQKILDMPATERTAEQQSLYVLAEKMIYFEEERFEPLKALKTSEEKKRYQEIEAALKKLDHLKPPPLTPALVAADVGPVAPPTVMKNRKGTHEIAPGFLTLLEPQPPAVAAKPHSTGRRAALAQWITRPDHPLTARVIVNRVWQHHFGRGLAGTPNDLGNLGERPTHPELLDFLARRFVAGGWKLKQLHRDILLSAVYQQTARHVSEAALLADPDNKLLWRYSPRRLDAEQARDAILAATGELDLTAGGPSVDPNTTPRRSIYTIKKRNTQNELLRVLDAPAGFSSIADRPRTSTPLQALLFLNGDWLATRARKLAAAAPSIDALWQSALGRAPTPSERQLADTFLATQLAMDAPLPDARADSTAPIPLTVSATFRENTPHERLLIREAPREADDFVVEAIVTLDSVDARASVRTIVSRWTGEKNSLEAHGWSLGVTGEKSAFKPRNLILQLVGEDENTNTSYEALGSGLFLELGKRTHVAVRVSTNDRTATFTVTDLTAAYPASRSATVRHNIVGKLGTGQSHLVIGGLYRRTPHQFDGEIAAVRVAHTTNPDEPLNPDASRWPAGGLVWRASEKLPRTFAWAGAGDLAPTASPQQRALTDLAHVLLNTNEFLYLH